MHHAPKLAKSGFAAPIFRTPSKALNTCERNLDSDPTGVSARSSKYLQDSPTTRSAASARDFTVQSFPTTVEDVPTFQVPANDIPGTKSLVDAHISKPRLKPPDPSAYEVAPRLFHGTF